MNLITLTIMQTTENYLMAINNETIRKVFLTILPTTSETEINAEAISSILRENPEIIQELDPHPAIVKFGKYAYQISLPKLCAALASGLQPFFATTINPSVHIGLGIIVTLVALDSAFNKLGLDEAYVCQILHEESNVDEDNKIPISRLVSRIGEISYSSENIEERVEKAVSKLNDSRVIEFDPDDKSVRLSELVLGRRGNLSITGKSY